MTGLTRREALLAAAGVGIGAVGLPGCGGSSATAAPDGSTLRSTWVDPRGDGQLQVAPGEALIDRLELGPAARLGTPLVTLAHLTDAHVLDASSPARVSFLDRLGSPFQSTFRPHETLSAQVLAGAVDAVQALAPDVVIQGGDLIDNDQRNELDHALAVFGGGRVSPGSGAAGYFGVQQESNPDPFYYRPDIDAPRFPGLLQEAVRPFDRERLRARWYPVLGDHDVLVAGVLPPTALTKAVAVGSRALWDLPSDLRRPRGLLARTAASASPDGPPVPGSVDAFLRQALAGSTVEVPPDGSRRQMGVTEVVSRLGAGPRASALRVPDRLDYAFDIGAQVRVIALDLARRGGGSGGQVVAGQPPWVEEQLASAGQRWVLFVSHHPLVSSEGGEAVLAVLDRSPRVVAALSGHTHRNLIRPRKVGSTGGYWLISTASLIDFPQQARALRLRETEGGGVALQVWMLDHAAAGRVGDLGTISRQLAYVDAQGGRPAGFRGSRMDRNVTLLRAAAG